jgi:hypothetical protein
MPKGVWGWPGFITIGVDLRIRASGITDVGLKREDNEDSFSK